MSTLIDLTGKKFNRLLVIGLDENVAKGKAVRWKCICDCGNEVSVRGNNLKSGAVKSCGCLLHQNAHNRTHGESHSRLYRNWKAMVERCENPRHQAYKHYGARGIKVCDEWKTYEGFRDWVNKTRNDDKYTIERIDVNGNYCPENCTWIPNSLQAKNRTSTRYFTYQGDRLSLVDWSRKLHIDYKLLHNRITKLGWTFEKAISTPVDIKKRNKGRING